MRVTDHWSLEARRSVFPASLEGVSEGERESERNSNETIEMEAEREEASAW